MEVDGVDQVRKSAKRAVNWHFLPYLHDEFGANDLAIATKRLTPREPDRGWG